MNGWSHVMVACVLGSALVACAGSDGAKGDKGDPGVAGTAGAKGDPGGKGDKGETGATGDKGETGVTGAKGDKGDPGQDWPGPAPAAYAAADGLKGGAAFSQWYSESGAGKGDLTKYGLTVGSEFVRCKTCHAWDGLGNAGSYANRTGLSTGTASRPDVSDVNLRVTVALTTYQELYDLVAAPWGRPVNAGGDSRHPDFSTTLDAAQIWNLVKFMREEWVEPNDLYTLQVTGAPLHYEVVDGAWTLVKPTLAFSAIGKDGDAAAGKVLFESKCSGCHGADGKTILMETDTMTLGQFVRAKPHEAWFKVKFGNGGVMKPGLVAATADLKNLYKALADSTAFPDK